LNGSGFGIVHFPKCRGNFRNERELRESLDHKNLF
jgi:hypothetical protein